MSMSDLIGHERKTNLNMWLGNKQHGTATYKYNKYTSNAEEEEHVAQSAEYVDVYSEFCSI